MSAFAAAATAASSAASAAASRPLLAGLPPHAQALQRQRANLARFLADNAVPFEEMPYEPWTVVPLSAAVGGLRFEVRPAGAPLRGLQGVFSLQELTASVQEQLLLVYPGLLVTGALYESFCKQYYCPTGLELPALAYTNSRGDSVTMLIIGDPTALGALINDGVFGRADGQ